MQLHYYLTTISLEAVRTPSHPSSLCPALRVSSLDAESFESSK